VKNFTCETWTVNEDRETGWKDESRTVIYDRDVKGREKFEKIKQKKWNYEEIQYPDKERVKSYNGNPKIGSSSPPTNFGRRTADNGNN